MTPTPETTPLSPAQALDTLGSYLGAYRRHADAPRGLYKEMGASIGLAATEKRLRALDAGAVKAAAEQVRALERDAESLRAQILKMRGALLSIQGAAEDAAAGGDGNEWALNLIADQARRARE